jgi:hypothetical protein
VKIGDDFVLALMYGAGPQKLAEMLNDIKLKHGKSTVATVPMRDIWAIFPMPKAGFSEEELARVDLTQGDDVVGPSGETLRDMIRNTYHCKSEQETEYFLRRYIAS